ncbi:MAG TPA: hypothetical protein EYP55_01280 [Anaerolineae bacterium]|nr:hypothetical protein [Anaerolineae bacterium]
MRFRTYLNPETLVPMLLGFTLGALVVLVTTAVIAQVPTVTLQPGDQVVVECVVGPTFTPTATATATATATMTVAPSPSPTPTATATRTLTPTPTATATRTITPTPTVTRTPIPAPLIEVWFQPLDFGDVTVGEKVVKRNYIKAISGSVWVEAVQSSSTELTLEKPVPPFSVESHYWRVVDIGWTPGTTGYFYGTVEFWAGGRVVGVIEVVGNGVP